MSKTAPDEDCTIHPLVYPLRFRWLWNITVKKKYSCSTLQFCTLSAPTYTYRPPALDADSATWPKTRVSSSLEVAFLSTKSPRALLVVPIPSGDGKVILIIQYTHFVAPLYSSVSSRRTSSPVLFLSPAAVAADRLLLISLPCPPPTTRDAPTHPHTHDIHA